jgi:Ni/Co efflux regulator RcnB
MRVRTILLAAALAAAVPGPAEAWYFRAGPFHPGYSRSHHRHFVSRPAPRIARDREYDWAHTYSRVHGRWPDGGAHPGWTRGERLPMGYAAAPAVDWRNNRDLYAPARGYRWLRVGDDYLMTNYYTRRIDAVVLAPASEAIPAAAKAAKPKYVTTFKPRTIKHPQSYYEK